MVAAVADIGTAPARGVAVDLLQRSGLPVSDLTDGHMEHFFYCGSASHSTGLIGVELCGRAAPFRSLVVVPEHRAVGLGRALVEHAECYASARGARSMHLLATTAEKFFVERGYVAAARARAPAAIRATSEFAARCPASSTLLVKRL